MHNQAVQLPVCLHPRSRIAVIPFRIQEALFQERFIIDLHPVSQVPQDLRLPVLCMNLEVRAFAISGRGSGTDDRLAFRRVNGHLRQVLQSVGADPAFSKGQVEHLLHRFFRYEPVRRAFDKVVVPEFPAHPRQGARDVLRSNMLMIRGRIYRRVRFRDLPHENSAGNRRPPFVI